MIRRLRFKLVAATMLSLLLVHTVIMCALNVVNYRGIVQEADSVLDILRANGGRFPEMPETFDWRIDGPRYKSPELPFEIRYFSVLLSSAGEIGDADMVPVSRQFRSPVRMDRRADPPGPSEKLIRRFAADGPPFCATGGFCKEKWNR